MKRHEIVRSCGRPDSSMPITVPRKEMRPMFVSRVRLVKIINTQAAFALLIVLLLNANVYAVSLSNALAAGIPGTGLNVTLNSVTFVGTVTIGNIDSMRQSVLDEWHYPDATVSGATIFVDNIYRVGSQVGLDPGKYAAHVNFLTTGAQALQIGDLVYDVAWTLTDSNAVVHQFSTLGYEDALGEAKFEPLIFLAPTTASPYIRITTNTPAGNDVEFTVTRKIGGLGASGTGKLNVLCNQDGTIASCTALSGGGGSFLYDFQSTHTPPTQFLLNDLHCCKSTFMFGFAYGFSSVSVGVDGFTISVSGSIGWKGKDEYEVVKCCPKPVPTVSEWGLIVLTLLLLTAGTLVIGRQRRRPVAA